MLLADYIAESLVKAGIRHVFGVGGANIEDLFAAVQRQRPRLRAVLAKHEHAAGAAADAYARLTGGLGVVLTTSGGGAMNVVHALAEARASRVPLLALIGEPPTDLQGRGAFQDTSGRHGAVDAAAVFAPVAVFCRRVARAADLPSVLAAAIATASGPVPGPAVVLIAKDLQIQQVEQQPHPPRAEPGAPLAPDDLAVAHAVRALAAGPVVIIAGDEVGRAGASDALERLADRLDARVAVAPDARDAFDNASLRFLGVAGAMGHGSVARGLSAAGCCLLVGTRLPSLARMGLEGLLRERPLVALTSEPPFLSPADCVHVRGELRTTLEELLSALPQPRGELAQPAEVPEQPAEVLEQPAGGQVWSAAQAARAVARSAPAGGVIVVDAGNTGAEAVHHVAPPPGGRWLLAMGMAGMGWSFGAAIGAACATGRRCTVLAGDGAFFMHGMEVHTAVEHRLPITFVVFNNRAHGMCLVRERLLLKAESGYNSFRAAHLGAGLAAMFPGLAACDCTSLPELEAALGRARDSDGPAVIVAELPTVDVPPFLAFEGAR